MNILLARRGEKFSPRYITMLEAMAAEHAPGAKVTVLTDQPEGTHRRELRNDWPGWWAKMELFAPWNEDLRPALFLDLDTYLLGDISDLASYEAANLWMLADFNRPERGASGVMLLPKDTSEIWARFAANPEEEMRRHKGGDQTFVNRFPHRLLQERFHGITSYKKDRCQTAPKGRLLCFHGVPKPHEAQGWAGDIWNTYGRNG